MRGLRGDGEKKERERAYWLRNANRYLITMMAGRERVTTSFWRWRARSAPDSSSERERETERERERERQRE